MKIWQSMQIEASVDGICFNFGYLPGSDHSLATKPEAVKRVIEGLRLLKKVE